jgi:hypothetical protein
MILISTKPFPGLQSKKWSRELVNFLELCTRERSDQRPAATELLAHPWFHTVCSRPEFVAHGKLLAKKLGREQHAKPCLIQ